MSAPLVADAAALAEEVRRVLMSKPIGPLLQHGPLPVAELAAHIARHLLTSAAMQPREDAVREAKAEALREWISEWPTTPGDGTFLASVARDGLERAAALTPTDATTQGGAS